ncbi:unnamed protein product [Penicillium roqueforti FM164]|uniref:Genomic scaffold, ProqFM164S01 n=1 Tax=Penicillium roqueforti (strain FM164) TaxID=1365484 RepID=W6PWN0_PENRF|nr:unnamed protein product [Penicillium roqueforti FM164]
MSQSKLKARIEGPVQMHIPSCRKSSADWRALNLTAARFRRSA